MSAPGDADRMDPRIFAYTLGEHVADVEGDDRADAAERIAKELRLIREALEDHDDAKEERE